jgi:hypothetical protein
LTSALNGKLPGVACLIVIGTEGGVAPHVIERLLNHVTGTISGVAAIYNRATYMPEMRAAVELWENKLTSLLKLED